jgi:hypothetical protein
MGVRLGPFEGPVNFKPPALPEVDDMSGHQFKAHGKLGLKIGIPTIDPEFWPFDSPGLSGH